MAIDYRRLIGWEFEEVEHTYTERDSMLYALGVGLGTDPTDERQLRFLYERDLLALPTMGTILAYPGMWLRDPRTGVDWRRVVHGEQGLTLHRPIPPHGTVVGSMRVTRVLDRGKEKGAYIFTEREVRDAASGERLCTAQSTTVGRADGGFGGPTEGAPRPHPIPDREPDRTCDLPTLPQAALIYRLSGDRNPLHADPDVARAAGFARPILHGLCTYGVAGHALLRTFCDYRPERLLRMDVRFSAPVFPGETIRTEMWREAEGVSFRARSVERDIVVLNNGFARLERGVGAS
jgi:acyl dehydratase